MSKKLAAILTLIYMICPIDLIPDVIPILGWLDDVFVLLAGSGYILMSGGGSTAPAPDPVVREAEGTTVHAASAVVPTPPAHDAVAERAAEAAADAVVALSKLPGDKKLLLHELVRRKVLAAVRQAAE